MAADFDIGAGMDHKLEGPTLAGAAWLVAVMMICGCTDGEKEAAALRDARRVAAELEVSRVLARERGERARGRQEPPAPSPAPTLVELREMSAETVERGISVAVKCAASGAQNDLAAAEARSKKDHAGEIGARSRATRDWLRFEECLGSIGMLDKDSATLVECFGNSLKAMERLMLLRGGDDSDPQAFALRREWERGCQVEDRDGMLRWLNRVK